MESHFPVYHEAPPDAAALGPVTPEPIPANAALKAEVLAEIEALPLPANFLDELVDLLGGPGAVAEMTGGG